MKEEIKKKKINGFDMLIMKDDPGISRVLNKPKWFRKWHREPEFMDIIMDEVKPGMTVLDLGANIGYVSLLLGRLIGNKGFMYAAEPDIKNFNIMSKNIKINNFEKNTKLDNVAFSDTTGKIDFYISDFSNMHSIIENGGKSISVNSFSLDDYFHSKEKIPEFIKMDIEGAEVNVLSGMDRILDRAKNLKILMEVHPSTYVDAKFADQISRLCKLGFKVKYLVSASTDRPKNIIKKGYNPIKTYTSGKWKRGVYKNVDCKDAIDFLYNKDEHTIRLSIYEIIKRPWLFFTKKIVVTKIVRAIMLERKYES